MPDGISSPKQRTLRTPQELVQAGLLPPEALADAQAVATRYAIAVPPALAARIETPHDPLGLQFIPDAAELITAPHEDADPIADEALSPIPGIVHRYPDRALLKPLLACPVYCRFCFRREQVGPDGGLLSADELDAAYTYIAEHPAIREIILTGGDPLILSRAASATFCAACRRSPMSSCCASIAGCRWPTRLCSVTRCWPPWTSKPRSTSPCTPITPGNSTPRPIPACGASPGWASRYWARACC
ncbi:radical SAM protein [Acidocella sp. MX-AZ03]|uniref:radical SAM protein n=1 Tax=Acidocella sp. MX-AZ03 TaxID=2697363 RepID=UPI0022DD4067|nr:radical SAM protein [Acidocella sp. MX-AZ03]WBO59722.1 radical SAM protein [Acidocella sp. MX-AZ03]